MIVTFNAYGHPNIRGAHRNTFEFTADKELTLNGDCIIGVKVELPDLSAFRNAKKLVMTLSAGESKQTVTGLPNPGYTDRKELVCRKSGFLSARTFMVRTDKSAIDLDRRMMELMRDPNQVMIIEVSDA